MVDVSMSLSAIYVELVLRGVCCGPGVNAHNREYHQHTHQLVESDLINASEISTYEL